MRISIQIESRTEAVSRARCFLPQMVGFYKVDVRSKSYFVYMSQTEQENKELISNGVPIDVWFHVEGLASAHLFLRLPRNLDLDSIPQEVLTDVCQLLKAHSPEGCKKSPVRIAYTMWNNLKLPKEIPKDTHLMPEFVAVEEVRYFVVESRQNDIVKRLNKTKYERDVSFILQLKAKWESDQQEADMLRKHREAEAARLALQEQKMQAGLSKLTETKPPSKFAIETVD